MLNGRSPAAVLWMIVATATACGSGDDDTKQSTTTSSSADASVSVPDAAPAEYAQHPTDWVLPGRDYDNARSTRDSTITAANVDDLDVAWEANLEGALSTVPLIVDDTVYVQDSS